jgi:hypothetical protein
MPDCRNLYKPKIWIRASDPVNNYGDLFMSLIHTCELAGANPFQYLTELQHHADAAALNPAAWLPWTYHDALAAAPAAPG